MIYLALLLSLVAVLLKWLGYLTAVSWFWVLFPAVIATAFVLLIWAFFFALVIWAAK